MVGVNGAAGVPIVASWWKASNSAFVMMSSWVEFKRASCQNRVSTRHAFVDIRSSMTYVGAEKDWTLQEYPCSEVRPLLLDRQGPVADFHHIPILESVCLVDLHWDTDHAHIVVRIEVDRTEVLDVRGDDARDVAPRRARISGHTPRMALRQLQDYVRNRLVR